MSHMLLVARLLHCPHGSPSCPLSHTGSWRYLPQVPLWQGLPAPCLCPASGLFQSWFSNSLFSTLTIPLDKTRVGFYLMVWSTATFWACKVSRALFNLLLFLSHKIWLHEDHRLPSCAFLSWLVLASFTLLFWKSPEQLCNSFLLWKQRDSMYRSWRTKISLLLASNCS